MLLRMLIWNLNFQMHAPNCEYLIGWFKARDFQNIFSENTLQFEKEISTTNFFFNCWQDNITEVIIKTFLIYWNVDLSRHLVSHLVYPCSEAGIQTQEVPHPIPGSLIGLYLETGRLFWKYRKKENFLLSANVIFSVWVCRIKMCST